MNKSTILESLRARFITSDLDECLQDLTDTLTERADDHGIIDEILAECRGDALVACKVLRHMVTAWQRGVAFENERIGDEL